MTSSDRLLGLLLEWEENRRQGREMTPEEMCPGEPALQQALRERIGDRERFRPFWTAHEGTLHDPGAPPRGLPAVEGFELLGEIGRGAMGVVYRARQVQLGRLVALKVIPAGAAASPNELARFRREAEATARLSHSNIVQVYEVGEHNGCPYLALEYIEGGSLAQRLGDTPLPARYAAELVRTLANAVQHAHARGVLHRDLKPGNVLMAADGTPKIADFGLVKLLDRERPPGAETRAGQTQTGAVLGTPCYMAPEQAVGQISVLGPAADVYGLGAILYQLLTGRPPFRAATVLETLEQVRKHDAVRPTILQPGLPRDLETICLKCLEKVPGHRYLSAAALADDLDCFLRGETITARSLTLFEKLVRAIAFSGAPAQLRSWGSVMLLAAPVPALIQLTLLLLFGGWPSYPLVVVLFGVLAACMLTPVVLWPLRGPLRTVPRAYRRFVGSMMATRCAGWLLVPALVALWRPGHDLSEFLLVYPLWIFLDGNFYCMEGSEAGIGYLAALVHYIAAVLGALAPTWAPLILGLLMSGQMVVDGIFLRRLGE
jgi:serine/threonine-protein kinase